MARADGMQVVLGAGGGTGRAIVTELARQGRQVRAVSRTPIADLPPGVDVRLADVVDPAGARQAVENAAVVYHAAQPPYRQWAGNFERLDASVADATAAAGARLVFADNLYMYGPTGRPMVESSPQGATDKKGRLRIALAADLLARHARGQLEVVIGRSSDYFGPYGLNTGAGERIFATALSGRAARWAGRLDTPHSLSYLPDLARSIVVLGDRDEAAGRAWHLPVTDPLTGREFLSRLFTILGTQPRIRVDSPLVIRAAGLFSPTIREFASVVYQWDRPWVSDWSAFEAAFGPFERTPLDEALGSTLDWWREHLARAAANQAA